ncbi:C2 domain-containing protein 3 isoform X2 [Ambystoma mexicanum]|uniref:C2 domain-containing protein 3 isoform X2 n=1 Tax=Ambystoma mexicanum TaxID=8296 RepID=UPI0037E81062
MKTRRSRATSKKRIGISDISPSTSLPPLVEGQLRCFLRITVSKLLWTIPKPPPSVLIRLRWWGETSDGTVFRPRITSQIEQKTVKTTARFAIRCGPKQFTSYLTDMGVLVLEVMTKADHLPIGRVQINGLPHLSPTHPISGFFTVVSPTSEKLGELQVSLGLEPLSETYDSCNSIPTTDLSSENIMSALGSQLIINPSEPQTLPGTIGIGKDSLNSSRATTPRGRDYLYFQENAETSKDSFFETHRHQTIGSVAQDGPVKSSNGLKQLKIQEHEEQIMPTAELQRDVHQLSLGNPATKDLLSVLLDQGNRLRNAMVVSAMKSDPGTQLGLDKLHPTIKMSSDKVTSVETSPVRYWDGMTSPPESLSAESEIFEYSELNDPHYDESLLEHLFYSAPKSDSSLSALSEGDGTKSSRKALKKRSMRGSPVVLHKSQRVHEFKEKPADGDNGRHLSMLENRPEDDEKAEAISLTVDRLALLGRIRLARVIVESLKIPPESNSTTPSKKKQLGKPPRPAASVKRTFFVEFHFPVASTKTPGGQVTMATEITRIASSKIVGGVVAFRQRFVFPVHFGGVMIEHWWNSDLTFKVFLRKSTQKKPVHIGSATLSLRDVIQSEMLFLKWDLPVHPVQEDEGSTQFGPLKVSIELAGDSKDFTSANSKTVGATQPPPIYAVTSPGMQILEPESNVANVVCLGHNSANVERMPMESPKPSHEPRQVTREVPQADFPQHRQVPTSRNLMSQFRSPTKEKEEVGLLLHVILMVPDGKDFVTEENGKHYPCNVYLNIKLFSAPETSTSSVAWGTTEPTFLFSQVAPVSLTRKLLERLKNNVMIIEAWNKVPSHGQDKLLGLVKLPLHQFYMSFSDPKISRLLLQAQYPVVAVDSYMPVVDMFTGNRNGSLRVLLAMGSGDQVVALQRLKNDEEVVPFSLQRPTHFIDPQPSFQPVMGPEAGGLVEHIFEIHVDKVKGLAPLQSTVWGEADCYVQYYFPAQEPSLITRKAAAHLESGVSLKPVRSSTTLCIPDPVFSDRQNHSLLSPPDVPVQRLLLSAFSNPGQTSGGIPFEVWCRYYYPNVRDQMVAKGILPLSRLCAMVTMQHREEVGIQIFNLPLTPVTESPDKSHPHSSGLLDVSVKYRHYLKTTASVLAARTVSVSVQVHRASGLQAASRVMAEQHPCFQYSADVGVNTYVTFRPSFLPESEKRHTRVVARTFYPEIDHHTEFPCNLVIQRSTGESCSLAELLQHGEVVFSIFHQNIAQGGEAKFRSSQDYLLGVVKVPTRDLLTKRSGISGWYPVSVPEDMQRSHSASILQTVVGGLDLSIAFAHRTDRDRVVDAAQALGWPLEEERQEDSLGDSDEWQRKENLITMSVSIPRVWLPVQCMLFAGQKHVHKSTHCYLRYKLYNGEPICTSLTRPKVSEDGKQVTVMFEQTRSVELTKDQPLVWYLREERLEIQVWRAYGKDPTVERPLDTDRLIGCAYVDLSPLRERTPRKLTVSGVYPLFKRNACDLSGASVRVHIALASAYHCASSIHHDSCTEDVGDTSADESDASDPHTSDRQKHQGALPQSENVQQRRALEEAPVVDTENTFAVNIVVERAMHLSLKGSPLTERNVATPSSCVSFPVAGSDFPISTPVIENTDSPVWNFQQQARLPKELLLDPQQTLVFKVWHKTDVERVIGFASVDLSPLLSGFQSVCGWYNIGDFCGHCQGQIKVSITPLESIFHLKEEKRGRNLSKALDGQVPAQHSFPYQTGSAFSSIPNYTAAQTSQPCINATPQEADFSAFDRNGSSGLWAARHEEHMQNVRRFHESMQQAERHTFDTGNLDSLSQSSRTSLLSALRKNLGELDDIQRYFNQKLTVPFPSINHGSPMRRSQEVFRERIVPEATIVDTDSQQLLDKTKMLVSQVSDMITDLQVISKDNTPSSNQVDRNISSSDLRPPINAQHLVRRGGDPVVYQNHSAGERENTSEDNQCFSSFESLDRRRGMLDEFLKQSDFADKDHFQNEHSPAENAVFMMQSCSEEDYDEDVIEPRTLNEVTAFTDKTSPWSSMLSEGDPEPDKLPLAMKREEQQMANIETAPTEEEIVSSLLGSVSNEDLPSRSAPSRSNDSPPLGENSMFMERSGYERTDDNLDTSSEHSFYQNLVSNSLERASINCTEPLSSEAVQWPKEKEVLDRHSSNVNNFHESNRRDEDSQMEAMQKLSERRISGADCPQKPDDSGSDEERNVCRSGKTMTLVSQVNSSGLDCRHLSDEPDDHTEKSSALLSDPVLVPNFFLPPQHLEASMRMLHFSTSLPSTHKTGNAARAIPLRRHERHKRDLTSTVLPKEETERIARIFAASFSKKD